MEVADHLLADHSMFVFACKQQKMSVFIFGEIACALRSPLEPFFYAVSLLETQTWKDMPHSALRYEDDSRIGHTKLAGNVRLLCFVLCRRYDSSMVRYKDTVVMFGGCERYDTCTSDTSAIPLGGWICGLVAWVVCPFISVVCA